MLSPGWNSAPSNLFLLAPRVADSAWAGSARMSITDAQADKWRWASWKVVKQLQLGRKNVGYPILPRVRSALLEMFTFLCVFVFGGLFLRFVCLTSSISNPQNHFKLWPKASSTFCWASVNFLAFLRHKKPGYFFRYRHVSNSNG